MATKRMGVSCETVKGLAIRRRLATTGASPSYPHQDAIKVLARLHAFGGFELERVVQIRVLQLKRTRSPADILNQWKILTLYI
jgi:hypothetical protein